MRNKHTWLAKLVTVLAVASMLALDLLPVSVQAAEAGAVILPPALIAQASETPKRRKTLLDLLFGNRQRDQAVPQPERRVKPKPAAALPATPKVAKAETATRLWVIGDSMGNDLAKALERYYAEDPNLVVVNGAISPSGFVNPAAADWPKLVAEKVAERGFDIAVMMIGINDNQSFAGLDGAAIQRGTPEWSALYSERVTAVATTLRGAGLPLVFVGLPPMEAPKFGQTMVRINEIDRLAVFSAGGEFVDIYDRFAGENGGYTARGPDVTGVVVRMRKDDGIHLSSAGADKLAFFVGQSLRAYYRGAGGAGIAVTDPLAGTDAMAMLRPPYQGLGQMTLLRVAGPVTMLSTQPRRAADLVVAGSDAGLSFSLTDLVSAPAGRADSFAVPR
jgi:hypothetical protein